MSPPSLRFDMQACKDSFCIDHWRRSHRRRRMAAATSKGASPFSLPSLERVSRLAGGSPASSLQSRSRFLGVVDTATLFSFHNPFPSCENNSGTSPPHFTDLTARHWCKLRSFPLTFSHVTAAKGAWGEYDKQEAGYRSAYNGGQKPVVPLGWVWISEEGWWVGFGIRHCWLHNTICNTCKQRWQ